MPRSLKKGPFIDLHLLKKVEAAVASSNDDEVMMTVMMMLILKIMVVLINGSRDPSLIVRFLADSH